MSRRSRWISGVALAVFLAVAAFAAIAYLNAPGIVVDCDTRPQVRDGVVYSMPNCG